MSERRGVSGVTIDGIIVIAQNGVDYLPATTGVTIAGNLVTRKHFWPGIGSWGIALFSISQALLQDNYIQEFEYGLQLGAPNSRDSILDDNKFQKNNISVGIYGSDDNLIIDNNFSKAWSVDVEMSNVCPYSQC
ncbi:NosD domain-containing protein, partial [Thermodesulfobacteriota bacterium]